MAWSEGQQLALALVPKFSSVLSLIGSIWISVEVLFDKTPGMPKRQHPYHRLLLAMSIYDILESVWNFLSTWPIPKGTEGVWRPMGTTKTCTAQGFFLTLSVAVPIYNAFLALYYLLVINYNMKDEKLRQIVEPVMHGVAFFWAFGTALTSAWMGLINNANLWCWIAPYPAGCLDSRRYGSEGNCERGDNAWIYRWAFYFAPLWFCILFATVCTIMVAVKVYKYDQMSLKYRRPERVSFLGARMSSNGGRSSLNAGRSSRTGLASSVSNDMAKAAQAIQKEVDSGTSGPAFYFDGMERINEEDQNDSDSDLRSESQSEARSFRSSLAASFAASSKRLEEWNKSRKEFKEDNPRSAEVFHQACWYLVVFYLTHVWSTTNRIIQQRNNGTTYFGIILVHSFFDPLQGFLNFVVYQRPRFIKERKKYPKLPCWKIMWRILRPSLLGPPPDPDVSTQSSGQRGFSSQLWSGADLSDDNMQPRSIRSNPNSRYSTNERFSVTEPVIVEVDDESSEADGSDPEGSDHSSNSKGEEEEARALQVQELDTGNSRTMDSTPDEAVVEGVDSDELSDAIRDMQAANDDIEQIQAPDPDNSRIMDSPPDETVVEGVTADEPIDTIREEKVTSNDRYQSLSDEPEILPLESEEKKDDGLVHLADSDSKAREVLEGLASEQIIDSDDVVTDDADEQTILFSDGVSEVKDSSIDEILNPVHQC